MPLEMPRLFLARHGDTAWTDSRQRTGRTDMPLNEAGEERARQLGERLRQFSFARVFTSPLQRASKTCELAGFGAVAEARSGPGRVGLRPLRGDADQEHLEGATRLGVVSRRLPRRRITRGRRLPGRPVHRACARHRGRRAGVLERAHHPDDRGPLARPAAAGRTVLLLPPRQRGRARLRAQEPGRTDHRPLEPRPQPGSESSRSWPVCPGPWDGQQKRARSSCQSPSRPGEVPPRVPPPRPSAEARPWAPPSLTAASTSACSRGPPPASNSCSLTGTTLPRPA